MNAGLLSVPVEQYMANMDFVESYLAHAEFEAPNAPVNRHEQTAHALLMSALGAARLPSGYALSGPVDSRTISFHYVDDGTNRQRFWHEGVSTIAKTIAKLPG